MKLLLVLRGSTAVNEAWFFLKDPDAEEMFEGCDMLIACDSSKLLSFFLFVLGTQPLIPTASFLLE